MGQRVLITGGAGFIGLALAHKLRQSDTQVRLLDQMIHNKRLQCARAAPFETMVGDVCDAPTLTKAAQDCSCVVHLASLAGISQVSQNPITTMQTILIGTQRVLEVCLRSTSLQQLVLVSTSEVYGAQADQVSEQSPLQVQVGHARWSYAAAKIASEQLGFAYLQQHGLPLSIVRPFNIYGPGQLGQGAINTWLKQACAAQPLTLYGGSQIRAWCYIDDFVEGLVNVLTAPNTLGQIYNLGNPSQALPMRDLAQLVVQVCGSSSPIVVQPALPADVQIRIPDIQKAKNEISFQPRVTLAEGVGIMSAHINQSQDLRCNSI